MRRSPKAGAFLNAALLALAPLIPTPYHPLHSLSEWIGERVVSVLLGAACIAVGVGGGRVDLPDADESPPGIYEIESAQRTYSWLVAACGVAFLLSGLFGS